MLKCWSFWKESKELRGGSNPNPSSHCAAAAGKGCGIARRPKEFPVAKGSLWHLGLEHLCKKRVWPLWLAQNFDLIGKHQSKHRAKVLRNHSTVETIVLPIPILVVSGLYKVPCFCRPRHALANCSQVARTAWIKSFEIYLNWDPTDRIAEKCWAICRIRNSKVVTNLYNPWLKQLIDRLSKGSWKSIVFCSWLADCCNIVQLSWV